MKMMHIRIFPLFYVMILVAVFVFNEDKHRGRRNLRSMCPPGLDYCHEQKKERLEETEAASRAQDEAKERRIEALEAKKVAAAQQAAVAAQRREATEREAEKLMAKTMREFHGSRRRAKKNGISGLYDEARALVYVAKELAVDPEADERLEEARKARETKWRVREAQRKRSARQSSKRAWSFNG